jgi:hypothetical protein
VQVPAGGRAGVLDFPLWLAVLFAAAAIVATILPMAQQLTSGMGGVTQGAHRPLP